MRTIDSNAEDEPDGSAPPLTVEALASLASASPRAVQRLIDVGALTPGPSGQLSVADVSRVKLAMALAEGGIDAESLMWAVQRGFLDLEQFAYMWRSSAPDGLTFGQFTESLAERGEHLASIYSAFGVGMPPPDTLMGAEEQDMLRRFVELWSDVDPRPDVAIRAARIAGDGIRRLQLGTVDLFDEFDGSPPARQRRGLSTEDANRPSIELAAVMPDLLAWLLGKHLEHEIFDRVVRFMQVSLAREGLITAAPDEEPAIAFVDLTGFTELTARLGDEGAAESAASLQALALGVAMRNRGRVVKLLGDGVMLQYRAAEDAVRSTLELMDLVTEAGLPAAHAGIATGPLVTRDGDVYGNTVNLASRIASHAPSGELLIEHGVDERLDRGAFTIEDIGPVVVKGIDEPIRLARVRR